MTFGKLGEILENEHFLWAVLSTVDVVVNRKLLISSMSEWTFFAERFVGQRNTSNGG